jgi:hypothetical protein
MKGFLNCPVSGDGAGRAGTVFRTVFVTIVILSVVVKLFRFINYALESSSTLKYIEKSFLTGFQCKKVDFFNAKI